MAGRTPPPAPSQLALYSTPNLAPQQPHLARTAQNPPLLLLALTVQDQPHTLVTISVTRPGLTFSERASTTSVHLASFTNCPLFSHSPVSSSPLCCKGCGRESGPRPLLRMFRAGPSTSRGEGHAGTGARPAATPTPPPSQSPPSRPRRSPTRPPPSSGIKYKSIPSSLSYHEVKFQPCGVLNKRSNMLPKLIDWQCKSEF